MVRRGFVVLMFLLGGALNAQPSWVRRDWGPILYEGTDPHGNTRRKSFGPIVESIQTPQGDNFQAFRPFTVRWTEAESAVTRREILWPLASAARRGDHRYWRVLLAFGVDWDVDDPASRRRLWILPFWFSGRDKDGNAYRALFPLHGTIREFLFWDRVEFTLFPLRIRSVVRQTRASSWFWPVYSRTEGPGLRRFRVFPFFGYTEQEGKGRVSFVMWPFWTSIRSSDPRTEGSGWVLFPLAGHARLGDQETWWLFPPFFRYTRGEERGRLYGPWPFLQHERDEDLDKFYLWPLYGRKRIGGVSSGFFLWPLGSHERIRRGNTEMRRLFFLPIFQHFREEPEAGTHADSMCYTKVWPLFSHQSRNGGESSRTVFPDLNPMRGGPIERNLEPFWRLYSREKVGEAVDTEILWGLWRSGKRGDDSRHRSLFPLFSWSREPDRGHFSLLKGLLSRTREGHKTSWRLLYLFRFGGKQEENPTP